MNLNFANKSRKNLNKQKSLTFQHTDVCPAPVLFWCKHQSEGNNGVSVHAKLKLVSLHAQDSAVKKCT